MRKKELRGGTEAAKVEDSLEQNCWEEYLSIYECSDRRHEEMETVNHLKELPYLRNHKGLNTWASGTLLL